MRPNGNWIAALGMAAAMAFAPARAQDTAAYFRVVSPTTTTITAFSPDGTMIWSNAAAIGNTGCIQRATTLFGPSNWLDYARHTVTNKVMTQRLFDPDPPSGMVFIPGGVNSGTNPLAAGEAYYSDIYPQTYSQTVSSFYMDRYEVTKALWDEVKNWNGGNGYSYTNAGSGKATNHPVHTVSWYDCVKWCNARSQKEGWTPVYYTDAAFTQVYKIDQQFEPYVKAGANGYRLPTEAQWEYAARGGLSHKRFPWGDTIDHDKANYYGEANGYSYDTGYAGYDTRYFTTEYPYTSPVGSFAAGKNVYGLYDMAGNVWEWCYDWLPGSIGYRVYRGGSFVRRSYNSCRVGGRGNNMPDGHFGYLGFRTVLPLRQ